MKKYLVVLFSLLSFSVIAETITEKDLVGEWLPSEKAIKFENVTRYKLIVNEDLSATYTSLKEASSEPLVLDCEYKPSNSQDMVFVFYCVHNKTHLITLSLGGWSLKSGYKQLFGFEYWLTFPSPGNIYNGIPVTLSNDGT